MTSTSTLDKATQIFEEMLTQRGYSNIRQEEEYLYATKPCGEDMYVFLNIIPKLNIDEIKNCISKLQEKEINHCIVIYEDDPTSKVKKTLENISNVNKEIELFDIQDVKFNITKHVLVPRHEKLIEDEAKKMKETYGANNMAVLSILDPISKFYNYKKGDVIKIHRKGGVPFYRIVR
jgi:DNA-directed RNA polymerase I, II, and III subunit RPABC1